MLVDAYAGFDVSKIEPDRSCEILWHKFDSIKAIVRVMLHSQNDLSQHQAP